MGILRCINLNISWKFGSIEIRKCQRRLTLTDEQNSSQEDSCIKIDLISRPIKEGEKSSSIGINRTFMREEMPSLMAFEILYCILCLSKIFGWARDKSCIEHSVISLKSRYVFLSSEIIILNMINVFQKSFFIF